MQRRFNHYFVLFICQNRLRLAQVSKCIISVRTVGVPILHKSSFRSDSRVQPKSPKQSTLSTSKYIICMHGQTLAKTPKYKICTHGQTQAKTSKYSIGMSEPTQVKVNADYVQPSSCACDSQPDRQYLKRTPMELSVTYRLYSRKHVKAQAAGTMLRSKV